MMSEILKSIIEENSGKCSKCSNDVLPDNLASVVVGSRQIFCKKCTTSIKENYNDNSS